MTVIGADLAERYDLRVGDTFTMRERDFEVIGVLERTLTFPDKIAYVPLRDAQEIYVESRARRRSRSGPTSWPRRSRSSRTTSPTPMRSPRRSRRRSRACGR